MWACPQGWLAGGHALPATRKAWNSLKSACDIHPARQIAHRDGCPGNADSLEKDIRNHDIAIPKAHDMHQED